MKIELFTFCNYAANDNGRLTIVDTLETIQCERLPWRAYFGFALKIAVSGNEPAEKLRFTLCKKGEKKSVFDTEAPFEPKGHNTMALAGNLRGLVFQTPGEYIFEVKLDETIIGTYKLTVNSKEG